MKESRVQEILVSVCLIFFLKKKIGQTFHSCIVVLALFITGSSFQLSALQYRRMDFQEFCAAAVSVHQLEALDRWEQHARSAYDFFEKDGNRAIVIDELASVCDAFLPMFFLIGRSHVLSDRSIWFPYTFTCSFSGTGSQPFSAIACCSARLDQAHRREIEFPWICQVIAWHVQQVLVKDEIAVDTL